MSVQLPSAAYAASPEKTPVFIFLSPFCGRSRDRLAQIVPDIEKIRRSGGEVSYQLILLSEKRPEISLARMLMCADAQQKFAPFFLYASNSVMNRKPLDLNVLISSLEIDPDRFKSCMDDVDIAGFALQQSDELFLAAGLTGVPSVMVRSRAFSLSDAESIITALQESSD
jgi:hypothetical protein